jgi:hypothetical protein
MIMPKVLEYAIPSKRYVGISGFLEPASAKKDWIQRILPLVHSGFSARFKARIDIIPVRSGARLLRAFKPPKLIG